MMTEIEFDALAKLALQDQAKTNRAQRIPLMVEFNSDLDTPLSLYLKVAQNQPYSFLLESVTAGSQFSRYSYVGFSEDVRLSIEGFGEETQIKCFKKINNNIAEEIIYPNVLNTSNTLNTSHTLSTSNTLNTLDALQNILNQYHAPQIAGLPRFCGGWLGYFGYESIHHIEKIEKITPHPVNHIDVPDIQLMLCDCLCVIDNLSAKSHLIVYANPELKNAYLLAQQKIKQILQQIKMSAEVPADNFIANELEYQFKEEDFLAAVNQAKNHIQQGDAMQIVLSQRMRQKFSASPISLYRSLRRLNPSPYMYFYRFNDMHIVGASPELLVRVENTENTENTEDIEKSITLRPIAGTRKRGKNAAEDQQLTDELLADPKECAEHTMLIDLARNDIGRIAKAGSVQLLEKMIVERYSHVQHIVSSVRGLLKANMQAMDVLKATFPAGTLSGAPKVRAMQIIRELEPHRRNLYGGAVGYIGFDGQMDLAIAIRSAIIHKGYAYIQAGAGLVYDSVDHKEWQETKQKAGAVLSAISHLEYMN